MIAELPVAGLLRTSERGHFGPRPGRTVTRLPPGRFLVSDGLVRRSRFALDRVSPLPLDGALFGRTPVDVVFDAIMASMRIRE